LEDGASGAHFFSIPFVSKQRKKLSGMISDVRRGIIVDHIRVVSKCHDSGLRDFVREKVLQPHGPCFALLQVLLVSPRGPALSIEAMDSNNAMPNIS
jgi:hypothetical protein